ncbi:MAG: 30S ribosome-binding factor RbfA [Verrucomicrobiales bacterium]
MQSLRHERVRELLKRQIGEVIQREIPAGENGLIVVNDVGLSKDLQSAVVYVGIVGNEEQKKRSASTLQKEAKRIQGLVGKAVVLKYTPQLKFVVDESIARGNRVLEIIDELDRSSSENEGLSQGN